MATSLDNFFMRLVLVCNTTEFCLFEKQYAQRYDCFFQLANNFHTFFLYYGQKNEMYNIE